jgi:hypothetical protein
MPEEKPRCCTDCRYVLLTGSRYLEKMSAWGYVGCGWWGHKEWTVYGPGFARVCRVYQAATPGDGPAALVAAAPPPAAPKAPTDLFEI